MKSGIACLFDLDGVIFDTEGQYSKFWGEQGERAHPEIPRFDMVIKGQTLKEILKNYFPGKEQAREMVNRIDVFESQMKFPFIPGVVEFLQELRNAGIKTAIVTSSDEKKMQHVYHACPEVREWFDAIVTADRITRSKPDPECYLLAAQELDRTPRQCYVFEDSFSGLEAGRRAGMKVVGLATTNPVEKIKDKAEIVIPDFRNFHVSDLPE